MATAMYVHPPIASKCVGGIRVVLCDPSEEVRSALRSALENDPLLVIVAEASDWHGCAGDIEDLVPELLIARAGMVPQEWAADDPFAPVVLSIREAAPSGAIPFPSSHLTLPIDSTAVTKAMSRAVSEVYDRKAKQLLYLVGRYVAGSSSAPEYPRTIAVESAGEESSVPTDSILAVIAARKSVVLHTATGKVMLREPIHRVASRLDPAVFVRIHRSVIVNCKHLDRASLTDKASQIVLRDGSQYPVGRNYREALTSLLQRDC